MIKTQITQSGHKFEVDTSKDITGDILYSISSDVYMEWQTLSQEVIDGDILERYYHPDVGTYYLNTRTWDVYRPVLTFTKA